MSKYTLSQGAGQKLEFAVQCNGGATEDIKYLSTGKNFRAVTLLRLGKFRLVAVTETGSEWTVDDEGNIHFTLISNGFTGKRWKKHLERRGFQLSDWARDVLLYASEAPTNGVAYHIVVRPSIKVASCDRVPKKIRAHAADKGWKAPHWEVACLIRDTFTDEHLEKMGLWWIETMHEPNTNSGVPKLLQSYRDDDGPYLYASYVMPDDEYDDGGGFAFVVPQEVSSQT
jgi:hypothetical protein